MVQQSLIILIKTRVEYRTFKVCALKCLKRDNVRATRVLESITPRLFSNRIESNRANSERDKECAHECSCHCEHERAAIDTATRGLPVPKCTGRTLHCSSSS